MMSEITRYNRRHFLRNAALTVAAANVAGITGGIGTIFRRKRRRRLRQRSLTLIIFQDEKEAT